MTKEARTFIVERWIPALRSGEYKQGKDRLRDHQDRFCCLGVACDLYAKDCGKNWVESNAWYFDDRNDYPSETVAEAVFGDKERCRGPRVPIRGIEGDLAFQNDSNDATFAEIADALEQWVNEQEVNAS